MKVRIARLGVLLAAVVGLVASSATPAGATTAGVLLVQGTAAVGNGIAYPCLMGKTTPPSVDPTLQKCLGFLAAAPNAATVAFGGQAVGAVVDLPPKGPAAEAGVFAVAGTGTVFGACGLSNGSLAGAVTPTALSVGTKPKTYNFNVVFYGVGGVLVVVGTATGPGGKLVNVAGAVVAVPDPTAGSCLNKAQKSFIIAGPLVIAG